MNFKIKNKTMKSTKVMVSPAIEKSNSTVESILRGGEIKTNPKDAAAVESVKDIYKEIGALAVSIDTANAAKKKLDAKIAATDDGKKLAGVKAKIASDKKKFKDLLSMYKGQLLLCKKQDTVLPAEIINTKLLNS